MISIRRHMLFILLTAFVFVWSMATGFSAWNTRHRISQALESQLEQAANIIWLRAQGARETPGVPLVDVVRDTETSVIRLPSFAYQVWDGRTLLVKSENAPNVRMSNAPGSSAGDLDDKSYRFYYRVDAFEGLDVIVAVEDDFSGDVSRAIAWRYTWPLVLAMPFIGLAIVVGVNRGLAPLRQLARQITERSPSQMAPIEAARVPSEVKGIVHSLNNLLARLAAAIEGERRFTANASHELRTPLAAIQAQSQVAQRAKDPAERDKALQQIRHSVERATHLVDQLLTLARLDPDTAAGLLKPLDLTRLLQEELAELSSRAREKNVEIALEAPPSVGVEGDPDSLSIMVRNLLDNAVRYTPEGGSVTVSVDRGADVRLSVRDTGPGIPAGEREKVFDRFYRIVGAGSSGAGLGLSIVKRIADLHGATLALGDNAPHGLAVTVSFPRLPVREPEALAA